MLWFIFIRRVYCTVLCITVQQFTDPTTKRPSIGSSMIVLRIVSPVLKRTVQ